MKNIERNRTAIGCSVLCIIMAVILFFVAKSFKDVYNSIRSLFVGYEVIEEIVSPDGKYKAVVYESNGGATTKFVYHVSIMKASQDSADTIENHTGEVYRGYPEVEAEWGNNKKLVISAEPFYGAVDDNVFVKEETFKDIDVVYQETDDVKR